MRLFEEKPVSRECLPAQMVASVIRRLPKSCTGVVLEYDGARIHVSGSASKHYIRLHTTESGYSMLRLLVAALKKKGFKANGNAYPRVTLTRPKPVRKRARPLRYNWWGISG